MLPLNLYARVRISLCKLHTRPRVQRAPGLPCALYFQEGAKLMQTSDALRRENALACATPTIVIPGARVARAMMCNCTSENP